MPQANSSVARSAPAGNGRTLRDEVSKLSNFGHDPAVLTLAGEEVAGISYAAHDSFGCTAATACGLTTTSAIAAEMLDLRSAAGA